VVVQVPRGTEVGAIKVGVLCIPHQTITALGTGTITDSAYLDAIQHEMQIVNYPITTSMTDLFTTAEAAGTRVRLAGRITDLQLNVCYPLAGFGDFRDGTADASVTVEWQMYDSVAKSMIFKTSTTGYGSVKSMITNPGIEANEQAVGMATRHFIADPEFQYLAHTNPANPPNTVARR